MSIRFLDGHGYCDFDGADYKYLVIPNTFIPQPRGGFWNPLTPLGGRGGPNAGTRSGSIDYGPWARTSSLHMKNTSSIWYRSFQLGAVAETDLVLSFWLYPIRTSATRSIVLFQRTDSPPNLITTGGIQLRPDGKLQIGRTNQLNVNFFPAEFDNLIGFPHFPTGAGAPGFAVSNATLSINTGPPPAPDPNVDPRTVGWTHVSLIVHFDANSSLGRLKLFINGCADIAGTGLQFQGGATLITPVWNCPIGSTDELCISQFVVSDVAGENNSNVSQFLRIDTSFPNSDIELNWGGGGFSSVNANPGPSSSFLQLASLAAPDEVFGIQSASPSATILAAAPAFCLDAPTQTTCRLFKSGGTKYPGATLGPLSGGKWTRQEVLEANPATSAPWAAAADINANGWGIRGLSGTGEKLYQLFVEIASQAGPARCGTSSYTF